MRSPSRPTPDHRVVAAFAGLLVAIVVARLPGRAEAESVMSVPIHPNGASVERALQTVWAGYIRDDATLMRDGLDRLERDCRRIGPDESTTVPKQIASIDRAFHAALDAAREFAGAGDVERSYEYLKWLPLGCRKCHVQAAEAGLAAPSSASPADSENPIPPSESRPSR